MFFLSKLLDDPVLPICRAPKLSFTSDFDHVDYNRELSFCTTDGLCDGKTSNVTTVLTASVARSFVCCRIWRIYGWQVDARTWMKLALQTSLVESSVVQIESSLIMYEIASQILFQHVQFQASHFLLICAYNSKHHLCLYNSKHFCRVPQTYKNTECVVFKRHYKSFWQWTLVKCWMIKTFTKLVCNPAQTFVQMLILTNRVSQTFSKSSCVSPFLWIPFPRYSPFFLVSNLFFIPI